MPKPCRGSSGANFNPRAPCGARLRRKWMHIRPSEFQSTRPVWGATGVAIMGYCRIGISIHAPRVGRDICRPVLTPLTMTFQSTRPVWGATTRRWARRWGARHFNPRAPCGARPCRPSSPPPDPDFNPRAPCGARRRYTSSRMRTPNFNPRAPCGARRSRRSGMARCRAFQSTRPVWGATLVGSVAEETAAFQSTRPVWGATFPPPGPLLRNQFQSTRPVWGATRREQQREEDRGISIHAPRVGRDSKFDDFTPSNLHKRYKRVLARPKNTREKGKIKQKLAYIHAFSAFLGCEGSGTFCALVLRTQYR